MVPHNYLEQGLSVLQARLRAPRVETPPGVHTEIRPFITLSRETGAGATTLGRELIPLLNHQFGGPETSWVFLDRDLLTHALTRHQLPERLAEYLPEDRISEIRAAIGELVGLHPSLWQLEQKVTEAILQLAHVGYVIFAGRASHLITRGVPGGLHVRLVASRETRVLRTANMLKCSHELGETHIEKNDAARRRFVQTHFGKEIEDPHLYDLVLNTDLLSMSTATQIVLIALRDRLQQSRSAPNAPAEITHS